MLNLRLINNYRIIFSLYAVFLYLLFITQPLYALSPHISQIASKFNISASTRSGSAPLVIKFSSKLPKSSLLKGAKIKWQFGDGTSMIGKAGSHTFNRAGRFNTQAILYLGRNILARKNIRIVATRESVLTPTPTVTPTPQYQCDGSLLITNDFNQADLSELGTATNLALGVGGGQEPQHSTTGHPFVESTTILQAEFDTQGAIGADSSNNGLDLGCTSCPTSSTGGRYSASANFSGSQGLVTPSQLDIYKFSDTDFSWSGWFKSSSSANQSIIDSYCGYGHLGASLTLNLGRLNFRVDPESTSSITLTSSANFLNDNQWHHFAAIRVASTGVVSLYIDGALDSQIQGAIYGGPVTCGKLAIGMHAVSGPVSTGFIGNLDEIALYSRALSQTEITRLSTLTRTEGAFLSKVITLSNPLYALSGSVQESASERSRLEVSFDGIHWCELNGTLSDPNCSFPSSTLQYRLTISDPTIISGITLTSDCTPMCVDYDGDGRSAISSNAQYCSDSSLDCNDSSRFVHPGSASPNCACGSSTPTQSEVCADGVDNDCDGAIDDEDVDCYTAGKTYYVSSKWGLDSNTGTTPQAPIRTLEMAQSIISAGLQAGDRILYEKNSLWTSGGISIQSQGTLIKPIIVGSYGEGERPEIRLSGSVNAVSLRGASYVTIKGLHLTRTDKTQNVSGVYFDPQVLSDHVTISDMFIDGLGYGLLVHADNFILEDSIINDNENSQVTGAGHSQGLWVWSGDYGIVRNNQFNRNGKYHDIFDHNIYLGGGNYWLFEANSFTGASGTSIVFHGVQTGHTIRSNDFYDCTASPAIDISDYTTGQYLQDFIVERNRVHGNAPGAFWIRGAVNLLVRNNLFYGNGNVFNIGSGVDHPTTMTVEHNTFYNNSGLISSSSGDQITFNFNIFDGSAATGAGTRTYGLNLTQASSAIFVDASRGDFTPVLNSAAIDTAIGSTETHDFNGLLRPVDGNGDAVAVCDMGAIEFR